MVMEGETIHWGVMVYAGVHLGDRSPTLSTLVAPFYFYFLTVRTTHDTGCGCLLEVGMIGTLARIGVAVTLNW